MVFDTQLAITPEGSPLAVPIPVAPLVVCVTGISVVFRHTLGEAVAVLTVFMSFTVIIPAIFKVPQVNGTLMV